MSALAPETFANPVWHALHSRQSAFAEKHGEAVRFPADVAPFAALAAPTVEAVYDLLPLLSPGVPVWVIAPALPAIPQLQLLETIDCHQMVLPPWVPLPRTESTVLPLTCAQASELVALTDIAFPGFFRRRTCEMGAYFGVRSGGAADAPLAAMAGERFKLDGYSELSALCTHPDHRGRGYATRLLAEVVAQQRSEGVTSFLHVAVDNRNAIDLYYRLGFLKVNTITVHQLMLG